MADLNFTEHFHHPRHNEGNRVQPKPECPLGQLRAGFDTNLADTRLIRKSSVTVDSTEPYLFSVSPDDNPRMVIQRSPPP